MARFRKSPEMIEKEVTEEKALIAAVERNDITGVEELLNYGVSPDATEWNRSLFYASKNYLTPLHYAVRNDFPEIVTLLLRRKANVDAKDRYDVTPLHLAAEKGSVRSIQLLLEAGADCTATTKHSRIGAYTATPYPGGTTPLHLAAANNHECCAIELIWHGADYNAVDEHGRTSLYIAAQKGFSDCVLGHLRNAIRTDILSIPVLRTGDTPLHECIQHRMKECVKELIKMGSDVSHKNASGQSPLHLALGPLEFNFDIVKEIVLHGYNIDLDMKDDQGNTPLHYVCFTDTNLQERRPRVAAFLIAMGANPNIRNRAGDSLLVHELRNSKSSSVILSAILDSVRSLRPVDKLLPLSANANQACGRTVPGSTRKAWTEKVEFYNNIVSQPRSLQHLARCIVREALGPHRILFVRPQSMGVKEQGKLRELPVDQVEFETRLNQKDNTELGIGEEAHEFISKPEENHL